MLAESFFKWSLLSVAVEEQPESESVIGANDILGKQRNRAG